EFQWHVGNEVGYRRRLGAKNCCYHIEGCFLLKRDASSDHFVKHNTDAPNVRATIDLTSASLFRRHVSSSSDQRSRCCLHQINCLCVSINWTFGRVAQLGHTKVEHFEDTVTSDHQVFGFDVAVNNS